MPEIATEIHSTTEKPRFETPVLEKYDDIVYEVFKTLGGSIDHFYSIGGRTVCLRFAGTALIPYLTPALNHPVVKPTLTPALTICLWDQASTGIQLPPLLSSFIHSLYTTASEQLMVDGRGELLISYQFFRQKFWHYPPPILP